MPETEITELVEGTEAERVDAVVKPASGRPFLLLKAEGGTEQLTESQAAMLASQRAGERLDRIMKERQDSPSYDALDPMPYTTDVDKPNSRVDHDDFSSAYTGGGVHDAEIDGIIASLMKEAHGVVGQASLLLSVAFLKEQAAYGRWEKAKYSADEKRKLLSQGKAMRNAKGDPSYPIVDEEDLSNAIHAVGRGGASHDAVRRYIIKRAKAMGKTSMIPENWGSSGSMSKASPLYMVMDPMTAELSMPGSPEWETEDAQRLIAAGQILAQLIQDLQASMGREGIEVATGAADDQQDVCMLDDAICACEYALGIVAKLAFREEAEAANNPQMGAMAKQERLTEESVDVIRQAVSFLKSDPFGSTQPAPAGSGINEEVDVFMTITKDDLAAAVGEGVALALQKSEEARETREAERAELVKAETEKVAAEKIEADRLAKEEAEKAAAGPETQPDPAKLEKEEAEKEAAVDMAELIKSSMNEALSPLDARLAALEGRPATGGPIVGAGGAGFTPGAPRGGEPDGTPPEVNDLRARIQKAEAEGDEVTSTRLRKELGQSILGYAFAARGASTQPGRVRAPQYTDNAAAGPR